MKPRHLMTAALGALVLSCQGPAAVLAQETAGGAQAIDADPSATGDKHTRVWTEGRSRDNVIAAGAQPTPEPGPAGACGRR